MTASTSPQAETFQQQFHRRWHHLNDPHVRDLAWLLDAPDMLDPRAAQWSGKIATLGAVDAATAAWLTQLDRSPAELHALLAMQPLTRLGRYAEKLMAFYFRYRQVLVGHGMQVQAGKNDTVGEFDFLLRQGGHLVHWEFATKFYLLESSGAGLHADYFVGPNLADTLSAKMHKILDKQLALARHPAAQHYLPEPVKEAKALIKGWLFYHADNAPTPQLFGVSDAHCRGFWCALGELAQQEIRHAFILPRLRWLAPAKVALRPLPDIQSLRHTLYRHFEHDTMPVLVALLQPHENKMVEVARGFVVPNDWRERAAARRIGI